MFQMNDFFKSLKRFVSDRKTFLGSNFSLTKIFTNSFLFFIPNISLALISLFSIPILISITSIQDWSKLVVAQSIGSITSTFVSFGWGISIPARLNQMNQNHKKNILVVSFQIRYLAFLLALPISLMVCKYLVGLNEYLILALMGTSLLSLTSNWYFVGESKPYLLLLSDTLPKFACSMIGLFITQMTHSPGPYLLGVLSGVIVSALSSVFLILGYNKILFRNLLKISKGELSKAIYSQRRYVFTSGIIVVYTQFPILLVSKFFPLITPLFIMSMKIVQFSSSVYVPVLQSIQGWINLANVKVDALKVALKFILLSSCAYSIVVMISAKYLGEYLSHNKLQVNFSLSLVIAVTVCLIAITQHLGITGLVNLGRDDILFSSTLLGALFSIPFVLTLGWQFGALGALLGYSLSEFIVFIRQCRPYWLELYR